MRYIPRTRGVVLPLLLASFVLMAVVGCGKSREDNPVELQPPFIEITGGPLDDSPDPQSYTARIFWTGWDEDGVITHYEYAIDPPSGFTTEEIGSPETSPGVMIEIIPGPQVLQDTLRVTKAGDGGKLLTFDWVQTNEFSRAFAFKTPNPDSGVVNAGFDALPTFSGAHLVYVRAQDNDGLFSKMDRIGYTAFTITPEAEIKRPNITADILNLGTVLTVSWDGLDPDSPEANKKPKGFIYRLLRLDILDPPIPVLFARPEHLKKRPDANGDLIWVYQDVDTLNVSLQLAEQAQYVFGVRAVDVAGAVEPFMEQGVNFMKFQAFASGGKPVLTVSEPAIGSHSCRGIDVPVEVQVPAGKPLRFTWGANFDAYGGALEGYSWGVDITDLDREGPNSGWSGWGPGTTNFEPVVFNSPGIHVFYVRVRDVAGAVSMCTLILNVIDFPLDREVLFLDDSFDQTYPRDSEQDDFWRARFQGYGDFSQVFEHHSHGPRDRTLLSPDVPKLDVLGRYKILMWDCSGWGYNGATALVDVSAIRPTLAAYLGAGGKLWLEGRMTIGATLQAGNGIAGDLVYPKEELAPGDFAYDFLKLHTTKLNNDKGAEPKNTMREVQPYIPPGPNPPPPVYEAMAVDPGKLNLVQAQRSGVSHVDAIFDPIFAESESNFLGILDSLYVYGATGNVFFDPVRGSGYHNRLCGLRWHDPDPDRRHGRIQWFGFPMYFFFDNEAQDTFNRSMDWLREEQLATP